jgi:hypothetical protein
MLAASETISASVRIPISIFLTIRPSVHLHPQTPFLVVAAKPFQAFDRLLLLRKGEIETIYFDDLGRNATTLLNRPTAEMKFHTEYSAPWIRQTSVPVQRSAATG